MTLYEEIDVNNVQEIESRGVVLIDVREEEEVAQGIIPGAINIPLSKINLEDFVAAIGDAADVVVYCKGGVRSQKACELIGPHIDAKFYNMTGGIMAWAEEGLPIK